jgi:prophage antirepressor-like protein
MVLEDWVVELVQPPFRNRGRSCSMRTRDHAAERARALRMVTRRP